MGKCELMTFARYADHDVEGCEAETDEQTLQLPQLLQLPAASCRSGSTWPPSRPWPPRWPPSDFPTRARLLSRKHTEEKFQNMRGKKLSIVSKCIFGCKLAAPSSKISS